MSETLDIERIRTRLGRLLVTAPSSWTAASTVPVIEQDMPALLDQVTALRAALEQAIKTCSRCKGRGRLIGEYAYDIPAEATILSAVVTDGYGRSEPVEVMTCPQCTPWRDLLAAQKVEHA